MEDIKLRYLLLILIVTFLSKNAFSSSFSCEYIGKQSIGVENNATSCDFKAKKYFVPEFQKGAEMVCMSSKLQKQKFTIKNDSLIYTLVDGPYPVCNFMSSIA